MFSNSCFTGRPSIVLTCRNQAFPMFRGPLLPPDPLQQLQHIYTKGQQYSRPLYSTSSLPITFCLMKPNKYSSTWPQKSGFIKAIHLASAPVFMSEGCQGFQC